ncbi:MAG: FAD-binding protein [Candidatus Hydrogenedens sp.]|nr:FAD-binding protein [Candidatus Hydrogenedens sp.]
MRPRKFWGWGYQDERISVDERTALGQIMQFHLPGMELHDTPEPELDDIALPAPRFAAPDQFDEVLSADKYERAAHTYGRATRDLIRGMQRDFSQPPDYVAFPESEEQIAALMEWCGHSDVALVPFGGGTSVVGGVEGGRVGETRAGVISLDMRKFDKVVEIDSISRAARMQAGLFGPALESALKPHGYTLRHFPQSFEFSTLGGWLATRAGGHYASVYTHIDDFVESIRMVTPAGAMESRRLPGSGAGPSPDRMMLGSEGAFGVITEAWMRLQSRPVYRAAATAKFDGEDGFLRGAECVRRLSQSGLFPTNCRLIDRQEALFNGVGTGEHTLLVLGFESADHPVDAWMARAAELCRDAGALLPSEAIKIRDDSGKAGGESESWKESFLRAPYLRDTLLLLGVIAETFETACTWDAFPTLYHSVLERGGAALNELCGGGRITCRFTHIYPDGPAPYFTVLAPGKPGQMLEQWDAIKAAVSETLIACGGTITHHHAVGRDHRPWYDQQRPVLFAESLRASKEVFDPKGIMNPGVLVDRG